jgi:hypothetical protein
VEILDHFVDSFGEDGVSGRRFGRCLWLAMIGMGRQNRSEYEANNCAVNRAPRAKRA